MVIKVGDAGHSQLESPGSNLNETCLWAQKALTAQSLHTAAPFVQDYASSACEAELEATPETCTLQAIQLRAAQKMLLLDTLVTAAGGIIESRKAPPKRRAGRDTVSSSGAPKGFGGRPSKTKRKQ